MISNSNIAKVNKLETNIDSEMSKNILDSFENKQRSKAYYIWLKLPPNQRYAFIFSMRDQARSDILTFFFLGLTGQNISDRFIKPSFPAMIGFLLVTLFIRDKKRKSYMLTNSILKILNYDFDSNTLDIGKNQLS